MEFSYSTIAMFATPVLVVATSYFGYQYRVIMNFVVTFHNMVKDGNIEPSELKEVEKTKVVQEIKKLVKRITK